MLVTRSLCTVSADWFFPVFGSPTARAHFSCGHCVQMGAPQARVLSPWLRDRGDFWLCRLALLLFNQSMTFHNAPLLAAAPNIRGLLVCLRLLALVDVVTL